MTSESAATCTCGSGAAYRCCCERFDQTEPDLDTTEMALYLGWEDLWPCEAVSHHGLVASLAKLDGAGASEVVARTQWLLREQLQKEATDQETALCTAWLDKVEARKVERWVLTKKRHKVIHRLNCLALQQLNFVLGQRSKSHSVADGVRGVLQCLIKANDLLHADAAPAGAGSAEDEATMAALVYRALFSGHDPEFGPAFGRYWAIMRRGLAEVGEWNPKVRCDLNAAYSDAFGLNVERMLALGLGVLAHYKNVSNDAVNADSSLFIMGPEFFGSITNDETKRVVGAFLEYIGLPWVGHAQTARDRCADRPQNLHQFTSMYRWPLVRLDERRAYPIDLGFCGAQATEGAVWALLEHLTSVGKRSEGNRLLMALGYAFEWYASEVVRPLHRPERGTWVWSDWDGTVGTVKGIATPDFLIQDGTTLYVVEATIASVPPSAALAGSGEQLTSALERIWGGGVGGSNKMLQLERAWRAATERSLAADGLDWRSIKRVQPVLLTFRNVPQHAALRPLYRRVLLEGGRLPEFVDLVSIVSVEEWEAACGLRLEGRMWDQLWSEWRSAIPEHRSLGDYLRRSGLLQTVGPPAKAFLDSAMVEMKALLFPV